MQSKQHQELAKEPKNHVVKNKALLFIDLEVIVLLSLQTVVLTFVFLGYTQYHSKLWLSTTPNQLVKMESSG